MVLVPARFLVLLAGLVWYGGAAALLIKGSALLAQAASLAPGNLAPWLAAGAALLAGTLRGRSLFRRACRRNLDRIARLERPRPWQFYRAGFFVALAAMIALGATLSRLAHGHFGGLLLVGALDLSIALALLNSSVEFWKRSPSPAS